MNLKPRKLNITAGVIAFLIIYFWLSLSTQTCVLCQLVEGTSEIPPGCGCFYDFANAMNIAPALIIGIIAYLIASFSCKCCCESKKKNTKNKGAD